MMDKREKGNTSIGVTMQRGCGDLALHEPEDEGDARRHDGAECHDGAERVWPHASCTQLLGHVEVVLADLAAPRCPFVGVKRDCVHDSRNVCKNKPRWKRAETASAPAMSRSHVATSSCESESGSVSSMSRSLSSLVCL